MSGAPVDNAMQFQEQHVRVGEMKSVLVLEPELIQEWLEQRQLLGQDGYDEVWEGVYHVAPLARVGHGMVQASLLTVLVPAAKAAGLVASGPANIGLDRKNFRAPDAVVLRDHRNLVWLPTAAIVVEVLSRRDETYKKFGFYFDRGVEEVLVVGPRDRTVAWFVRGDDAFVPAEGSALLGLSAQEVADAITWPAAEED